MSRCKILNVESSEYSSAAAAILREFCDLNQADLDRQALESLIPEYDGIIVRLRHRIDASLLAKTARLKFIASATTGLNHIDLEAAQAKGIAVLSLRGETAFLESIHATAEHTWALLLSSTRGLVAAANHAAEGGWDRDQFKGSELFGKTLGIIGLGRIGRKLVRYAGAFGMHVLAHDPYFDTNATPVDNEPPLIQLDELLERSDFVSINVSLTAETEGLLGREEIRRMPRHAVLINTSRGEVVDERALLEALSSGHLAGAAVDVLTGETSKVTGWPGNDPLVQYARKHSNLIVTPHIGGATYESMAATEIFVAEKIKRHLESAPCGG